MLIQPYVFFEGRCEEAIEFYQQAIGAQVEMVMRNSESPDEPPPRMLPPGSESKIMHGSLRIGDSVVMVSDGNCSGHPAFQGVSLSIQADTAEEAQRLFDALADGGAVTLPFGKTFFSEGFGMLADRFGVQWMVNTAPQQV